MSRSPSPGPVVQIPAELMDLLEGSVLGHLATVRANGTPHVTPIWVDHDGDSILVNVRIDRIKAANMRARPAVAISIVDPRKASRFLSISGRVVGWSEDGWREHIDGLSRRYLNLAHYPWSFDGERRAIFRIVPTNVYFET